MSSIHKAASKGDARRVSRLLRGFLGFGRVGVDVPDADGYTALHMAAMHGHSEVVKLLMENGANPKASVRGITPLKLARRAGHQAVIALLQPDEPPRRKKKRDAPGTEGKRGSAQGAARAPAATRSADPPKQTGDVSGANAHGVADHLSPATGPMNDAQAREVATVKLAVQQGQVAYEMGHFSGSLDWNLRAIEGAASLPPPTGAAMVAIAKGGAAAALLGLGRSREALASAEEAIPVLTSLDHTCTPYERKFYLFGAMVNKGAALIDLGRCDEAISSFKRARALLSDDPEDAHFRAVVANNIRAAEERRR